MGRRADSQTREILSVSGPSALDRANATTGSDLIFRINGGEERTTTTGGTLAKDRC